MCYFKSVTQEEALLMWEGFSLWLLTFLGLGVGDRGWDPVNRKEGFGVTSWATLVSTLFTSFSLYSGHLYLFIAQMTLIPFTISLSSRKSPSIFCYAHFPKIHWNPWFIWENHMLYLHALHLVFLQ